RSLDEASARCRSEPARASIAPTAVSPRSRRRGCRILPPKAPGARDCEAAGKDKDNRNRGETRAAPDRTRHVNALPPPGRLHHPGTRHTALQRVSKGAVPPPTLTRFGARRHAGVDLRLTKP